jgi:hypothetical protein
MRTLTPKKTSSPKKTPTPKDAPAGLYPLLHSAAAALSFGVVGAFLFLGVACTGPAWCEGDAIELSAHDYRLLAVDEDPFYDATDVDITPCQAEADVRVETLGLEPSVTVETTFCNHATVMQRLPVLLHEGTRIHTRIWYYSQSSFDGAVAQVRLRFDDDDVVSRDVTIPSESALISEDAVMPKEMPVGTPVSFHVGNHGDNSWNLLEVTLFPRAPCE